MPGWWALLLSVLPFTTQLPCDLAASEVGDLPARGFAFHKDDLPEGPWVVHVVTADLSHPNLEIHTTLANGNQIGLAPLSEQMKGLPTELGRPIAAVNGDYYRDEGLYAGDPKGLQIMGGELVSGPCEWTCFWIDTVGQPQMTNVLSRFEAVLSTGERIPFGLNEERGKETAVLYTDAVGASTHTSQGLDLVLTAEGERPWLPLQAGQTYSTRIQSIWNEGNAPLSPDVVVLSIGQTLLSQLPAPRLGESVLISTATLPDLAGVRTAIGGGPALVRNGQVVPRDEIKVRNPRTAIGWKGDRLYMVQVDGRQLRVSVGMTTEELSRYMVGLGCEAAMSLDGGGSSTCWVYGQVMNHPSEGFERDMANSVVLMQTQKNN